MGQFTVDIHLMKKTSYENINLSEIKRNMSNNTKNTQTPAPPSPVSIDPMPKPEIRGVEKESPPPPPKK